MFLGPKFLHIYAVWGKIGHKGNVLRLRDRRDPSWTSFISHSHFLMFVLVTRSGSLLIRIFPHEVKILFLLRGEHAR